jgi:hypothetical protein
MPEQRTLQSARFIVRLTSLATRVVSFVAWARPDDFQETPFASEAWRFPAPIPARREVLLALGLRHRSYIIDIIEVEC